jgi:H+/Cl- antiporter ClcA
VGEQKGEVSREKALELAYTRACASYEAITVFRGTLLGLLPLVTGTGGFLLLERSENEPKIRPLLGPIGLLGFVVTVGLFAYELRGMQRCSRLEVQAGTLEARLGLNDDEGPFKGQPTRSIKKMLGPPAAGLIIYLAAAFTWIYIGGYGFSWWRDASDVWWLMLVYLAVLLAGWALLSRWLEDAATGNHATSRLLSRIRRLGRHRGLHHDGPNEQPC